VGQQTISIDPDLWKRTRRLAFDMGTTATSIVEEALIAYFAAMELKQGGRPAPHPTTDWVLAKGPVSASDLRTPFSGDHAILLMPDGSVMDPVADATVSTEPFSLSRTFLSVDKLPPGDGAYVETKQMDAWPPPARSASVIADVVESHMDGEVRVIDKVDLKAIVINSPSEAAAAVQAAGPREFHPVPKPTTTKKARR